MMASDHDDKGDGTHGQSDGGDDGAKDPEGDTGIFDDRGGDDGDGDDDGGGGNGKVMKLMMAVMLVAVKMVMKLTAEMVLMVK